MVAGSDGDGCARLGLLGQQAVELCPAARLRPVGDAELAIDVRKVMDGLKAALRIPRVGLPV